MGEKKKKKNKDRLEEDFDNKARFTITPKGIAWISLYDAGIHFTDSQFEIAWTKFEESMRKHNYVQEV